MEIYALTDMIERQYIRLNEYMEVPMESQIAIREKYGSIAKSINDTKPLLVAILP
jgi:hypothetical protein